MSDEVCRRRLPGLPRRGTPVPGPGRGVRRGTPGHFFSAVHENPPFRDHPKMNYVKVSVFRIVELSFFSTKAVGWLMRGATSVPVIQMRSGALQLRVHQKYN